MALNIVWSKRASQRFDHIVSYLIIEWGEKSANDFIIKVFDFLDTLSEFPEIGSLENKEKNIRGFTLQKQVNLYYRIKDDCIILIIFFDNRLNPKYKKL
ncbi:MAG: type II toxin-antitoxin system RelE/ParE family toxin [Bacteroidales bacterium]|nr:type II toxin-antitoxin system RelE/ParE family toxin [Bacteroidales bacterium]